MRLRTTAFPVFLVTVNPKRGDRAGFSPTGNKPWRTNPWRTVRLPRPTARNSARLRSRSIPSRAPGKPDVNSTLPSGYNWALPASGAVGSSGTQGRQQREMDIGIRGFGNTANNVNNFGGTIRSGTWIDEVSVYNGIYTPADLPSYSVGSPVLGDYNGDHEVNAADYAIWRKNSPNNSGLATVSMGDGTGEGIRWELISSPSDTECTNSVLQQAGADCAGGGR